MRSSARLRDAVSDALCREIVRARRPRLRGRFSETGLRLGSQTSDRVPGTRGARSPATDFSSLGARNRWVPDFRIPVDVLARTSSRGRRRRRRRREARRGSGRRERDASATRARRERDANRREPTTVRAAAIERRGATEARARRFAFDLESRRSFASTREFRRVEGANADDARARDVG